MKGRALVLLMMLAVGGTAAGKVDLVTLPRREKAQLTIYNSADLTLVREQRSLTLKKGLNLLELSWANTLIDPTSLSLKPLDQAEEIEIRQLVFPAGVRQVGQWLIDSQISGQVSFEITYFTSGLSWRAFYMGTLSEDEKTMQLKSYVRLANNSGEEYVNAQTRLIVGKVHLLDQIAELARRKYAYGSPVPVPRRGGGMGLAAEGEHGAWQDGIQEGFQAGWGYGGAKGAFGAMKPKEIKKEGLSEYFLYTIEGTETIPDKWGKRLLSFEAEDIEVESLYKYDEQRWGGQTIRFVKFTNDEEHNLGETPIPNGNVKIYSQADDLGHLSYVGGTSVKYIPVDEEVELDLGAARLVKVEPKLMDFKTANYLFDRRGNVAGWDEVELWEIELANTRKLKADIEITRYFGTAYWDLTVEDEQSGPKSFVEYKKHDAERARFTLSVEPGSKRVFRYRLRKYRQARQEYWIQKNASVVEGENVLLPAEDGNFVLRVSNQSFALNPVDISVYVDGMKLLDRDFNVKGEYDFTLQHNWQEFKYKLPAGRHTLKAESSRGGAKLETEFKIGQRGWGVLNYWYYPEGSSSTEYMEKQFRFGIHDKPVGFGD